MNSWKVILATMVIFGAGVVTGGLLIATLGHPSKTPHAAALNRSIPTAPGATRIEFLRRAERELNLTSGQREQADKIMSASQERTKKIMEPVAPGIREELQQTAGQFRALLTPEQQTRFDELMKKQQRPRDPRHPAGKFPEKGPAEAPVHP